MSKKNIKVLITGGFGAIGYNLAQKLQKDDKYEIHIIDNLSAGSANFSPKLTFTYLDLSNSEKVNNFFKHYQPNVIFHLAAHFANQNSVDHPISDTYTNVIGSINLFEAQKNNSELLKIVYASSSCVYGNCDIMTETANVRPYETPYAINKFVGELYCKYYAEIHKIPSVCIRLFNSFGPGEMPGNYRNVIPNFINKALNNEDILITGTGNETRDFTYIDDTIDLLIKSAESQYINAEVFNAGTGKKLSIKELAENIIKLTNSTSKILYTSPRGWDHIKDRCSDISKSSALLGYKPESILKEGLTETINWLKKRLIK